MNQIIKYLLVAILSIALTIFYLDQHAPIIVEVPEKTSQRMSIEFSKEIERRQLQKIEKKAKNVIVLIGDGMGINQITAYKIAKGGPTIQQHLIGFHSRDWSKYIPLTISLPTLLHPPLHLALVLKQKIVI